MKKVACVLLFISVSVNIALAETPFAKWSETELVLNNGVVQRVIKLPSADSTFLTLSYKPLTGDFKYFPDKNTDFQFEVNGATYSGKSKWSLVKVQTAGDDFQGDGAAVTLLSSDRKIELILKFLLYPDLPVIRKSLVVKNLSREEVALESVDIEKFEITDYWATTFSWIYSDYGRRKSIGPYEGNMQDALIIVHNMDWEAGIVIGNEASGVLKRTSFLWDEADITTGLTHKDARFPFRKWIKPRNHLKHHRYLRWSITTRKLRKKY